MGSVIKTVTFYEKTFWREKGLNGVLISDSSPAYVTVDDAKPDGSYPAIMLFLKLYYLMGITESFSVF